MNKITWYDKYNLALQETLTIKQIQNLRSVGQPTALIIRQNAMEYCLKNDIELPPRGIPTEAVFVVTGKNLNFYYEKMCQESNAKKFLIDQEG